MGPQHSNTQGIQVTTYYDKSFLFVNLVSAKTYLVEVESATNTDIAVKNENGSDYFFRVINAVIGAADTVNDAGQKVGKAAEEGTEVIQNVSSGIDGVKNAFGL